MCSLEQIGIALTLCPSSSTRRWEGTMGGRVFRNNYKGHMDKTNGGWKQGREVGMAGVGG